MRSESAATPWPTFTTSESATARLSIGSGPGRQIATGQRELPETTSRLIKRRYQTGTGRRRLPAAGSTHDGQKAIDQLALRGRPQFVQGPLYEGFAPEEKGRIVH